MQNRPVILIVDDEISNIEIINAILENDYEICFATNGQQALELARQTLPDLILLDVVMPGMDGFETCHRLKQDQMVADVPVIFTTGLGDTEDEVHGLSLGAIDYVTKPIQPSVLKMRVSNHIELKRLRDQLTELAVTDALTGLTNRRGLKQIMDIELARLIRSGEWLSTLMIDIDFFKQYNDTYGHAEGDRCIIMVAAAIKRAVKRASDHSARYGGEEFACILPQTDAQSAMTVAKEIQSQVSSLAIPHSGNQVSPYVTVSIGVASALCQPGMEADLWFDHADAQLYQSKQNGRNQISAHSFEKRSAHQQIIDAMLHQS